MLWPGHSCSCRSRSRASSTKRVASCPPRSLAGALRARWGLRRDQDQVREEVRAGRRAWPGAESPPGSPAATASLLARRTPPRSLESPRRRLTCQRPTAAVCVHALQAARGPEANANGIRKPPTFRCPCAAPGTQSYYQPTEEPVSTPAQGQGQGHGEEAAEGAPTPTPTPAGSPSPEPALTATLTGPHHRGGSACSNHRCLGGGSTQPRTRTPVPPAGGKMPAQFSVPLPAMWDT